MDTTQTRGASFSIFSILALICAVLSFVSSGGLGLIFGVIAIGAGMLGVLLALLPSRRGGLISLFSVLAGFVGIGVAIARLLSAPGI
jgi:hypothetical protein